MEINCWALNKPDQSRGQAAEVVPQTSQGGGATPFEKPS